jgi:DAACS family dicarboxylate/amino acid:cation (Na+ or H+) symporter
MQLHNRILLGLVAGAACGLTARTVAGGSEWLRAATDWVAEPVGQVFLRLLLMTVVPLVFASVVLGVAGIGDVRKLGRTGGTTLLLFLVSTAVSVVVGLLIVHLVQPGSGIDAQTRDQLLASYRDQAAGLQAGGGKLGVQTIVEIVPRNPVRAAADLHMLGILFFSLMFGIALTLIPREQARPMIALAESLAAVVMKIIDLVLRFAPIGVFGLVFVATTRFGWTLLGQLGVYVAVVVAGLVLHAAVSLSAMVLLLGRRNPLRFWARIRAAMITAFSTSSSNATLPTTIAVAERNLGVPATTAGFVLPLGATMNMNGTALYEGITVLFLAQVFGVTLDLGQQLVVVLMAVLTAIGAAGVPGGSLPLLMGVLAAVGVPPESIAVILGVDRILDMCRTVVNVAGDLAVAVVVARRDRSGSG